jgi:quinol monooxygenase YgiN
MRFVVNSSPATSPLGGLPQVVAMTLALTIGATIAAADARAQDGSVYAVTYLDVAANSVGRGMDLLATYREASRRETGNLEFTVLQEMGRRNRFAIIEGWRDKAAFETHEMGNGKTGFMETLNLIRNSPPDRHVLQTFAVGAVQAEPVKGALYMVEHVDFMPTFGAAAPALVKAIAESTQKEPSLVRYDIYQQPAPRTNHYEVVAAWPNRAAFDAHEAAAYTRQFRSTTVMPGRANLYDQRVYRAL